MMSFKTIFFLSLFLLLFYIPKVHATPPWMAYYPASGFGGLIQIDSWSGGQNATLEDIYQADLSGGWNEVHKLNETMYAFDCRLQVGPWTETFLISKAEQIQFTNAAYSSYEIGIQIAGYGRLVLGELVDATNKITWQGSQIISLASGNSLRLIKTEVGGKMYLYSSSFYSSTQNYIESYGDTYIYNLLTSANVGFMPRSDSITYDVVNSVMTHDKSTYTAFALYAVPSAATFDKMIVLGYYEVFAIVLTYSAILKNIYTRGLTRLGYIDTNWSGNISFVNMDSDIWSFYFNAPSTGEIYRQYEFDLTTTTNSTVEISYYGQGGGTLFNETDADGVIPIQTINKGFYNYTGGNTIYSYEPFHLKISKEGYQTYEANFTLTEKTAWEIELMTTTIAGLSFSSGVIYAGVISALVCIVAVAVGLGLKKRR